MKLRTQCFLILFLTCDLAASAQLLIGPTLGPQLSWTSFDNKDYKQIYNSKPVFGFHAGVNVSFRVRKRFFLHTALIYSTKGKIIEGKNVTRSQVPEEYWTLIDPDLKHKATYRYLEMPILYTYEIKMHTRKNKEFKWYFGAGPNISYWMGGKGTFYNADMNENHYPETKYKIVYDKKDVTLLESDEENVIGANRLQLGLNFSAGLVFEPLGYQKFMITMRYELGHTFLGKEHGEFSQSDSYTDVLQARNNGIRLSIAYLVDMKVEDRKKGKSTMRHRKMR